MASILKNRLTSSPFYKGIMTEYASQAADGRRVKLSAFYADHIAKDVPEFSYTSFCQFIKKIEGAIAPRTALVLNAPGPSPTIVPPLDLTDIIEKSSANTTRSLAMMLDIGTSALEEIKRDPSKLSLKDRAAFSTIAMKAQDSRVAAVAKIKQDARDDMAFNRALSKNLYVDGPQE